MQLAVGREIYAAADMIRVEARRLIAEGAIQGRGHVASLPGQPPNWDTGMLANGIVTNKTGPMSAQVLSTAPHSLPLEFGTSKMAERPFMRPATARIRPKVDERVQAAVNRVLRKT
jgi:HK97 gp10 family phage protein